MKLEEALSALGEQEHIEAVRPHWDQSQGCFPKEALPVFLRPEQVRENRKAGLLAEYMEPPILAAAKRIAEDPNLLHLAWHCYRLTYHHPDYQDFPKWPTFEKALGRELHGIFYLLVGMAMVPIVRAVHKEKGIDEDITRDTLSDIRCFNFRHRKGNQGRLGIVKNELYWYRNHCSGELYRLGRLQYFIHAFGGGVEIYRNRKTHQTVALAEGGLRIRPDGHRVFDTDDEAAPENWTTTHVVDERAHTATGYPACPKTGTILAKKISLDLSVWEHKVGKGTGMLSMHIPVGGAMTLSECIDSMRQAFDFFPRIFPGRPFVGIDCFSWTFGSQIEEMFEGDSNLVRVLREGYLYPLRSYPTEGLHFIFYRLDGDIEKYPADTAFQRRILDWLSAGGCWRGGGWFVLKDDADHLGRQHYRSHWPPRGLDIQDSSMPATGPA